MKASYLVRGFPGHPLHPPLTDATIGAYTAATVFAVLAAAGVSEENTTKAWWLALLVGLAATVPTALTGLVDWLGISRGTPLRRTATLHLLAMLAATGLFALTAAYGHDRYVMGEMTTRALVGTLLGFGFLTLGGWLGGSVVYVHGMRVLDLASEPTRRATTPGHPEKDLAEGS
ncbi:MAG TPA: DUF2231 domain-containing protein [Gaiellaceae bacterium]|nr:DUF2231 domain-containing protein [Gaiellaceae bacterium]